FECHSLATVVHVRLEADEPRRFFETKIRIAPSVRFPRRNGQGLRRRDALSRDQVFGRIALREELEADFRSLVDRLFAVRVIVETESELRARLEKLSSAVGEDVAIVTSRVLDEERIAARRRPASAHTTSGRFTL